MTEPHYTCSITGDGKLMKYPVLTCNGQTYEKEAIEEWFKISDKDPLTNEKLRSKELIPNYLIKSLIAEYKEKNIDGAKTALQDTELTPQQKQELADLRAQKAQNEKDKRDLTELKEQQKQKEAREKEIAEMQLLRSELEKQEEFRKYEIAAIQRIKSELEDLKNKTKSPDKRYSATNTYTSGSGSYSGSSSKSNQPADNGWRW